MTEQQIPTPPGIAGDGSITTYDQDLNAAARSLLENAVAEEDQTFGFGSMSCAAYDTAWVSLVVKVINGRQEWLFPKCFDYLLQTQSDDGSWGRTKSQSDGILSTAASLLSLLRHRSRPLQLEHIDTDELNNRITQAVVSLRSQLQLWSISSTFHAGFEVIVPALLDLLAKEDPNLQFQFEGYDDLSKITSAKLSRFKPDHLYGNIPSTALHSLEAFTDKIDFDRIIHRKTFGSMMGSPSSTAAYLMNASTWDDEAETYLRYVIEHAAGKGSGGVPSAYPSTYFEYSWALSTLLTSGFAFSEINGPALDQIGKVLSQAFEVEGGAIGFAPNLMADVDDTAKTIVSLRNLGKIASPEKMIEVFETETHFKTYLSERDPSLSANCNALLALLHQATPNDYSTQITKITKFLYDFWWNEIRAINDKWNMSHLYTTLLFVEAFVRLVDLVEKGRLQGVGDSVDRSKVAVCLYQACYRTLLSQEANGSWNQSHEETAYGTLILCEARRLDLFAELEEQLTSAINRAITFIQSPTDTPAQDLWIEKVSYRSSLLADTYRLAALKASTIGSDARVTSGLRQDISVVPKLAKLWLMTPLFKGYPEWQLRASMVEGTLFRPIIRASRLSVFTRKGVEVDKYFDVIPLAWPTCNNRAKAFAPSCFLLEGMMASLLNYQVDEFIEAVAGVNYADHIPVLRQLVDDVIGSISKESSHAAQHGTLSDTSATGSLNGSINDHHPDINDSQREEVLVPLRKFVTRALTHPAILSASAWDRKNMTCEIRIYIQTHITQFEDSVLLKQNRFTDGVMREHFFRWVRTTSADHTSATYTFNFVCCLLSSWIEKGGDCFPSTQEKYFGAAACQHLATMCRMYNDYGSAVRDRDEANLNSIDFPEFNIKSAAPESELFAKKKEALFELAQYERACFEEALGRIEKYSRESSSIEAQIRKSRQLDIWRLFYNVTDLFGQIYVLRDYGSRLTVGAGG